MTEFVLYFLMFGTFFIMVGFSLYCFVLSVSEKVAAKHDRERKKRVCDERCNGTIGRNADGK